MKKLLFLSIMVSVIFSCDQEKKEAKEKHEIASTNYIQNRTPLHPRAYLELPLGAIQPKGWLLNQLRTMATGLTGNLDTIYPEVVGPRNGWLGGDGDGWERGPYWIDGLLPLAYILDDAKLKAKVRPWIEWTLNNQTAEGYIGPIPFEVEPEYEPGLQRGNRKDWWPKMVMLKILRQHYSATGDERVIKTLTRYFKYQLKELHERPLDADTFWAGRRGADNLQVVYWLYNITGEAFLLELGDLINEQTFPWTSIFLNDTKVADSVEPYQFFKMKGFPFDTAEIGNTNIAQIGSMHTVNLAQGLKQPIVRYQKEADEKFITATKKALADIKTYHGQPQGMYGGDEPLHGTDPVQGVEFCSVSEKMFSLETILQITGDIQFADLLERIAYNALPTQASDDFTSRQYFQAANQVELTDQLKESYETENHKGTDFVFGVLTGYPCCTTNMHQSWPKFVQNLFYATPDGGVAALLYGPGQAQLKVANGVDLQLTESTIFPFREDVQFKLELSRTAHFPFHLRIPEWTTNPKISINGTSVAVSVNNGIAIIDRQWKNGDSLVLELPMYIRTSQWHKGSTAIERGPLVYALKIEGEERIKNRNDGYGAFTEIYPKDNWNYALIQSELDALQSSVQIVETDLKDSTYPWNLRNAPIALRMKASRLEEWKLINGAPKFPEENSVDHYKTMETEEITLIPYGCTTLRITEFPVIPRGK